MKMKSLSIPLALIVLCGIVVLLFGAFKDALVKKIVCAGIEAETGVEVQIEELNYNPFKTIVEIKGLTIANPAEFGSSEAMRFSRIYIDSTLAGIFSDEIELQRAEIDIASLNIYATRSGKTNIDAFAKRLQSKEEAKDKESESSSDPESGAVSTDSKEGERIETQQPPAEREMKIANLKILIGKVVMHPPSIAGQKIEPKVYDIDETFEYEDVEDLDPLIQDILPVLLLKGGTGLFQDLSGVIEDNKGDLEEVGEEVDKASSKIKEELNNFF